MSERRLAAWALGIALGACALVQASFGAAASPYRGKVVDAETKQPLVGAAVVMSWTLELRAPGHPARFGEAEETVTDANGEFEIGTHAPRSFNPLEHVSDPELVIFQPGYGFFPLHHVAPRPSGGLLAIFKMMRQERVVIELPRVRTQEERRKVIAIVRPVAVPPEKIPYFTQLFKRERGH